MTNRRTVLTVAGSVVVVLLAAAGCSSGPKTSHLSLTAGSSSALFDSDLALVVTGATPNKPVHLAATATDTSGVTWQSGADFTASAAGTVDVRTSAATAGSYTGVHSTGLTGTLSAGTNGVQFATGDAATMAVTFTVTQTGGSAATAQQTRVFRASGVTSTDVTLAAAGFVGRLYMPPAGVTLGAPVMVLGGSEGGEPVSIPQALASRGHPALGVAYFADSGLPQNLTDVPLEYFAKALRWLAARPGVDASALTVFGASRGSEAALLVGVHYPTLVHSVIAASPSSVVNPGFPDTTTAAWTLGGVALPHVTTSELGNPNPANSSAIIPVAKIAGPVLLIYGTDDQIWPSGLYIKAMVAQLGSHPHTVVSEAGAGHLMSFVVPNLPESSGTITYRTTDVNGGTVAADALGRADAWPKLLAFLAQK